MARNERPRPDGPRPSHWRGRYLGRFVRVRPYLAGILVFAIGSIIAFSLFIDVAQRHRLRLESEFLAESTAILQVLQRDINWHIEVLHHLTGLFDASVEVTEAEFETFVGQALNRLPSINLLAWAPRVRPDDWAEWQAERGLSVAGVLEPASAESYQRTSDRDAFPIVYAQPAPSESMSLGTDMASSVATRTAMAWARDSGLNTATRPISLVSRGRQATAVVIFSPLYAKGSGPANYIERREALTGFVILAVTIEDLVEWAVPQLSEIDVDIHIFDIGVSRDRSFLYYFDADQVQILPAVPHNTESAELGLILPPLEVATRGWRVAFAPSGRFLARFASMEPAVVLALGAVLSLVVSAYFLREAKRKVQIEGLVEQRTDELEREIAKRRDAERDLTLRVNELEQTRDHLEQQGRQLAVPGFLCCQILSSWSSHTAESGTMAANLPSTAWSRI